MEYLLLVFAKHENQESFVKTLADDISIISDEISPIRYYYGDESIIFTFKCVDDFIFVKEFFETILGSLEIVYFVLPHDPDKMSYWLSDDIKKHLFTYDKKSDNGKNIGGDDTEVRNLMFPYFLTQNIEDEFNLMYNQYFDRDNETLNIKPKKHVKSLNELLDKIGESGIKSLTENEMKLLNNYSK